MSTFMWFVFSFVGLMLYAVVGGFVFAKALRSLVEDCTRRCSIKTPCKKCEEDATINAVFWLFSIPIVLGAWMGERTDKQARADKRRAEEIAEAKHRFELAQLQEREAAALNQELRHHGIEA